MYHGGRYSIKNHILGYQVHKVDFFLHIYLRSPRLPRGKPPYPPTLKDPYIPVKPLNQEVSNQR